MNKPLHLHAIVVAGGQVTSVPVIFDGGHRTVPRFSGDRKPDSEVALQNATKILGITKTKPGKKDRAEIYQDWNHGKEGENPFLKNNLLAELYVRL